MKSINYEILKGIQSKVLLEKMKQEGNYIIDLEVYRPWTSVIA